MRFEYYHSGLDSARKLSVDGTVPNSIHFSHWQGNKTPAEVKADTSTEIALNLVGSPRRDALTEGVELVTNNHFDTDGVLSVWTMLAGARAQDLRDKLVAAAEAGDFSEYSSPDGVRASIVIQGSDAFVPGEDKGSPLAAHLAGSSVTDEARLYELVLPEVERVIINTDEYESLWRDAWRRLEEALESFARGESKVYEDETTGLSLVTLAPSLYGPHGFSPARHSVPLTAISAHARGRLYLIAIPMGNGWSYRIDYPYHSWAETVVRPRVERHDFTELVGRLNAFEECKRGATSYGYWTLDGSELTSAVKTLDASGVLCVSSNSPEMVREEIRLALRKTGAASVGAARSD